MKKVENSIKYWGIYLVVLGMAFFVAPLDLATAFGYEASEGLWIRMMGMLMAVLGTYYYFIAYYQVKQLYYVKVATHLFGIVCMSVLWMLDITDQKVLPTLLIEFGACLWTFLTLPRNVVSQTVVAE